MADYSIEVAWEGGQRYRGGPAGGATLVLDGTRATAPGPVDAVLIALASCSAMDVVEILSKRRTPARVLRVHVEFKRANAVPRRLVAVQLRFHVESDAARQHVEHAVGLAVEKYCSVAGSLAADCAVSWSVAS